MILDLELFPYSCIDWLQLVGWGRNDYGQLGNGQRSEMEEFVRVTHPNAPHEGWKMVSCGDMHTAALDTAGVRQMEMLGGS